MGTLSRLKAYRLPPTKKNPSMQTLEPSEKNENLERFSCEPTKNCCKLPWTKIKM